MAEHHDVPDLEHLNCEFERSEHPVTDAVWRVCGHQVGNIAHHEQLARMRVENHLGRDPRVATADDHDGGGLAAPCELAIALALRRHAPGEKIAIAFDEPGWKFRRHRWGRPGHAHSRAREHVVILSRRFAYHAAAYAASKSGLIGLTQVLAAGYGPQNIRVNAILPLAPSRRRCTEPRMRPPSGKPISRTCMP